MSDIQAENDSESSLPTFRPFTREELAIISNRITEKRAAAIKRAERRARNIAVRQLVYSYNILDSKKVIHKISFCKNRKVIDRV